MSDTFTIEVEGLDEFVAACGKTGPELKRALTAGMEKGVLYVHQSVPPYPPAPAGSRYRRTGSLGRTVTAMAGQVQGAIGRVQPIAGGVQGLVGSALPYAPPVIGEAQAGMHRGRWWRLVDVVKQALPGVKRELEKAVGAALERLFG